MRSDVRLLTGVRNKSLYRWFPFLARGNWCHDLRHIRCSTGESHRSWDSFRLLALMGTLQLTGSETSTLAQTFVLNPSLGEARE